MIVHLILKGRGRKRKKQAEQRQKAEGVPRECRERMGDMRKLTEE